MEEVIKKKRGRPKGSTDKEPRGGRKLNPAKVRRIRKLAEETKLSYAEIQLHFPNVTRSAIEQIVNRRTWKSVE